MNFYNEFDPAAAAWLRELIAVGAIPPGVVDERSISDLQPSDLHGFTQCHFFTGIGGWSLALQLAGIDPTRPLWTGSCPCQPYSDAGKGLGDADPRNLWPAFFRLIRECRPELVFGEQVAGAIGKGWLDRVSADLEGEGYACGAAVLGAHSVGAPHIRKRLYWVADAGRGRLDLEQGISREQSSTRERRDQSAHGLNPSRLADSERPGLQGHAGNVTDGNQPGRLDALAAGSVAAGGAVGGVGDGTSRGLGIVGDAPRAGSGGHADGAGGASCGMGDAETRRRQGDVSGPMGESDGRSKKESDVTGSSELDHWFDSVWLPCRDGKHRRVPAQSVLQPVADGLPDLVGAGWGDLLEATPGLAEAAKGFPLASSDPFKLATRGTVRPALLKGTGNAIVPEVAATFIAAFYEVTQ